MTQLLDPYNVTPKEYAEAAARCGRRFTRSGAVKLFRRHIQKHDPEFKKIGERVFMRRGAFESLFLK